MSVSPMHVANEQDPRLYACGLSMNEHRITGDLARVTCRSCLRVQSVTVRDAVELVNKAELATLRAKADKWNRGLKLAEDASLSNFADLDEAHDAISMIVEAMEGPNAI